MAVAVPFFFHPYANHNLLTIDNSIEMTSGPFRGIATKRLHQYVFEREQAYSEIYTNSILLCKTSCG